MARVDDADDISTLGENEEGQTNTQLRMAISEADGPGLVLPAPTVFGAVADGSATERPRKLSRLARCGNAIERCLDKIPFPQIRPSKCLQRQGCPFRWCEANRCCFFFGKRGCRVFGNLRKLAMFLSLCLTCVSMLLRAMPAAALSSNQGNLNDFPWASGTYECIKTDRCGGLEAKVSIGLEALLVDSKNFHIYKVIQWSASNCVENLSSLGAGSYCRICDQASKGCAGMSFLSIATGLVNAWTDIQRMRGKNDHNCIKCLAIVTNCLGALGLMMAVSIFHGLCVSEFPLEDADKTFKINLRLGTGGALVASASSINAMNVVIHWMVPVPEARWKTHGPVEEDPAAGEWPSIRGTDTSSVAPFDGAIPGGKTLAGGPRALGSALLACAGPAFSQELPGPPWPPS
eukprot:s8_g19.t1